MVGIWVGKRSAERIQEQGLYEIVMMRGPVDGCHGCAGNLTRCYSGPYQRPTDIWSCGCIWVQPIRSILQKLWTKFLIGHHQFFCLQSIACVWNKVILRHLACKTKAAYPESLIVYLRSNNFVDFQHASVYNHVGNLSDIISSVEDREAVV